MNVPPASDVTFLAPTFKRAALIWWAWLWRSLLLGLGASLFVGLVLTVSGVLNSASDATVRVASMAGGVIAGVPMGIWAFQLVLEKTFGEFTIRLVPNIRKQLDVPADEPKDL